MCQPSDIPPLLPAGEHKGVQPLSLAQLWSIPFPKSSVVGMSPRRYVTGGTADSSHSDGRCVGSILLLRRLQMLLIAIRAAIVAAESSCCLLRYNDALACGS
jgi:hypothetical protein